MDRDWIRDVCLDLPHVTEDVKWENNLVFCVGQKMFAVTALEPGEVWLSFKCSPEEFAELTERPGIRPAPYLARAHWVALETVRALPRSEVRRLLEQAHHLVFAKLPKKVRRELEDQAASAD